MQRNHNLGNHLSKQLGKTVSLQIFFSITASYMLLNIYLILQELFEIITDRRIENPFLSLMHVPRVGGQDNFFQFSVKLQMDDVNSLNHEASSSIKENLLNTSELNGAFPPYGSEPPKTSYLYDDMYNFFDFNDAYSESSEHNTKVDYGFIGEEDEKIVGNGSSNSDINQINKMAAEIFNERSRNNQSNYSLSLPSILHGIHNTDKGQGENDSDATMSSFNVSYLAYLKRTLTENSIIELAATNHSNDNEDLHSEERTNTKNNSSSELYGDEIANKEYWEVYDANYNDQVTRELNSTKKNQWSDYVNKDWLNTPIALVKFESFESEVKNWLNRTQINEIIRLLDENAKNKMNYDNSFMPPGRFIYRSHFIHFYNLSNLEHEGITT